MAAFQRFYLRDPRRRASASMWMDIEELAIVASFRDGC